MDSLPAAVVMVVVAGYCAVRLLVSLWLPSAAHRLVDGSHLLMGSAMAGMFAPPLALPVPAWTWQVVFSVLGIAFLAGLARSVRQARRDEGIAQLDHCVAALAMVFMLALTPGGPRSMHGMSSGAAMTSASPLVGLAVVALTAYLVLSAVRSGGAAIAWTRRHTPRGRGREGGGLFMAPVWPLCCESAMGLAMAAMLFTSV